MAEVRIWGQYKDSKPEVIDRTTSEREAIYLTCEYQLAYGKDWKVWAGKRDCKPCDCKKHK
jgi:hypothetical protein